MPPGALITRKKGNSNCNSAAKLKSFLRDKGSLLILLWWRRGRVELPVQKKVARIYYKLSQLLLSHLAFIC